MEGGGEQKEMRAGERSSGVTYAPVSSSCQSAPPRRRSPSLSPALPWHPLSLGKAEATQLSSPLTRLRRIAA